MTTRYSNSAPGHGKIDSGYSGNVAEDFSIPSCTIEDVDRGVFNLFEKEMPFFYVQKGSQKKVPVIFATGERFALLSRNQPLRDKSDALILPLISVIRTGIDQQSAKGATQFQGAPVSLKIRVDPSDPLYQRVLNKKGIKNSYDIAVEPVDDGAFGSTPPGRLSTKRSPAGIIVSANKGTTINSTLDRNIYEFIEMPPIKQYTANYEVTFWAQYTQQMNDMLNTMMQGYVDNRMRTYVIETDTGYKFSAFVDSSLSPQNNFDDFTDAERLVKYSFTLSVAAYIVASRAPGTPHPFRRYVSAPEISFDVEFYDGENGEYSGVVDSGDPKDYILQDIEADDEDNPKQSIGKISVIDT